MREIRTSGLMRGKSHEAAKATAAWEAEQRAWRDACAAAKKAKKELPPQPAAKRPTHPGWIRSPFVYPRAEIRADEAYAAELATLEALKYVPEKDL